MAKRVYKPRMPELYGSRKRPCIALDKNGDRVSVSVKTALKKGFTILDVSSDGN